MTKKQQVINGIKYFNACYSTGINSIFTQIGFVQMYLKKLVFTEVAPTNCLSLFQKAVNTFLIPAISYQVFKAKTRLFH